MPKSLQFIGTHTNLETGKSYTVKEYAHHTGLHLKFLYNRLAKETHVTNDHITRRPSGPKPKTPTAFVNRLENQIQRISDAWLRKTL